MDDEDVNSEKRTQFGNRFLTDPESVFQHNAWDNVEWDEVQETEAQNKVKINSTDKISADLQEKYDKEADKFWDSFYSQHQNRFFKDRHWLFTEFPELAHSTESVGRDEVCTSEDSFPGEHASVRMFEVGCGVGNTVFPVLQTNNDPQLFMYCCDLSSTAIQLVQENKDFEPKRCHAFVCDISDPGSSVPFPDGSLDVIIMIFVLSAVNPKRMPELIARLARFLKPGGLVVFRDYGRYDLTQLRFKNGRCLEDNFYVRGDGTRVYFFTQDDLKKLFRQAGLVEEQNLVDRRLQVNRGRQLKMYRVWIQCKYRRPTDGESCTVSSEQLT